MTIAKAELLTNIAEDLNGFGGFDTSAGSHLERSLSNALSDLWRMRAWTFKAGSSSLAVQSNNYGPYDVPTDFDGFMNPDRVDFGWAYKPLYGMDNPIIDGENGQRYEVEWNRRENKLYFARNPGNEALTLVYRVAEPTVDDMSSLPDKPWVREFLTLRTGFHTLNKDEETMNASANMKTLSEDIITREWNHQRAGQTRQRSRTVMSPHGYPLKVGLSGENWWPGGY